VSDRVRGRFVVFEGVEGAGKSTQVRRLAGWLEARGVSHVVAREPGGTPLGESIRALLLGGGAVEPRAELLLVLAARAALVEAVVRPALAAGRVVLADRFSLSTLAYQGYGRGLPLAEVRALDAFARGGIEPDLTILLEVPAAAGAARRAGRGSGPDRIEAAGRAFHDRVAAGYRELAGVERGVERLDGAGTVDAVHASVTALLRHRFPETFRKGAG
jgi:dTMP kinase